jgi:hypothetical protein
VKYKVTYTLPPMTVEIDTDWYLISDPKRLEQVFKEELLNGDFDLLQEIDKIELDSINITLEEIPETKSNA